MFLFKLWKGNKNKNTLSHTENSVHTAAPYFGGLGGLVIANCP